MVEVMDGRFILGERIGKGSFGEIHKGEDTISHIPVAIKLEPIRTRSPQLDLEASFYEALSGGVGIPAFHHFGVSPDGLHQALVIDLLSASLEDLLNTRRSPFSLKTILMLADQMLSCVEWVHKHRIVHRDIKTDNFMLGIGNSAGRVYLIDFGLSKRYANSRGHIPMARGKNLTGTARYASINAMRGIEQSRRDDLEALGYVWVYLLKGWLPWQGLPAKNQKDKLDKILATKTETSIESLCEGLPDAFRHFFEKVRALEYDEQPEYSEYRREFRELFLSLGYIYDGVYDWMKPREPAGRRTGKRRQVVVVTAGAPKPGLPVLPPASRQQPGSRQQPMSGPPPANRPQPPAMPARNCGRTPRVTPRRPSEVLPKVVLPVLVH
jgi:serine/threonine protein kinase